MPWEGNRGPGHLCWAKIFILRLRQQPRLSLSHCAPVGSATSEGGPQLYAKCESLWEAAGMGGVGEGVCGGGGMRRSAAAVDFHINGIYSFFSFPAQVGLLPPPPPPPPAMDDLELPTPNLHFPSAEIKGFRHHSPFWTTLKGTCKNGRSVPVTSEGGTPLSRTHGY